MAKAKGAAAAAEDTTNATTDIQDQATTLADAGATGDATNAAADAGAGDSGADTPEAPNAKEAAAVVASPLAIALEAPENISSFSIEGHEYPVNEHGLIEIAIEDAHRVAIALEHGFQRAGKAVRNLL